MRKRNIEISVGALLLAGGLALLMLAVNVSGLSLSQQTGGYKVVARFDNIGGLTERAKVSLSGVPIGEVTEIRIDTQRLMAEVELLIYAEIDYLSVDSSAQILTAGLLGEKYIGITPGFEDDLLKEGGVIQDTQSALVLEDIVGKFLFNKVSE